MSFNYQRLLKLQKMYKSEEFHGFDLGQLTDIILEDDEEKQKELIERYREENKNKPLTCENDIKE